MPMPILVSKQTSTIHTTALPNRKIEYIVIHYTAGVTSKSGSAKNTAIWFTNVNARSSSDYIVDDGTIIQYNPDIKNRYTWHCGGNKYHNTKGGSFYGKCTNLNSIGIEVCSNNSTGKMTAANDKYWSFSDKEIMNLERLVQHLMIDYHIDADHVIRHFDVNGKPCISLDTELFTKNGWVPLRDVCIGDEIAQYLPEKNCIEYAKVEDVVEPYETEVLSNCGIEATANHFMYLKPEGEDSFQRITWGEALESKKNFSIKTLGPREGFVDYSCGGNEPTTKRTTVVSCVTVPSGYILIRQGTKTFIVGNCPGIIGWNEDAGDASKWWAFKERIGGTKVETQPDVSDTNVEDKNDNGFKSYVVRITGNTVNVRKGPGTNYLTTGIVVRKNEMYTIVEEAEGKGARKWGRLKSGAGWISLDYAIKV